MCHLTVFGSGGVQAFLADQPDIGKVFLFFFTVIVDYL